MNLGFLPPKVQMTGFWFAFMVREWGLDSMLYGSIGGHISPWQLRSWMYVLVYSDIRNYAL